MPTPVRVPLLVLAIVLATGLAARAARAETWTLTNHAGDYETELVRLKVKPVPPDATDVAVTEDGRPVACQVDEDGGVWVVTDIASEASHVYEVTRGGARPPAGPPRVTVRREGRCIVLEAGPLAVRVPAEAEGDAPPGPIGGVRVDGGRWRGASTWQTALPMKSFEAEVLGAGPLYGKVRLRYTFDGTAGLDGETPAFADVVVTLRPGHPVVDIDEAHEMDAGAFWTFDAAAGWAPTGGLMRRWFKGPFQGAPAVEAVTLKPGQTRLGDVLLNLQPRWTQAFDEGWFFGTTDDAHVVGAMVARAGHWMWGHDNLIRVRLKASGDTAGLECPTWRGRRYWYLVAGPKAVASIEQVASEDPKKKPRKVDRLAGLVTRVAFQPLNKLVHEYILEWPGQPPGGFRGDFFYSGSTNPTGMRRGLGEGALKNAGRGKGGRGTLSRVQVNLDPDWFCGYWQRWSPINPNFHTDFIKYPVGAACDLTAHPRFDEIARRVEDVVRTDLYHAVTLPGGAGQECPGYLQHAMSQWKEFAKVAKQHLGFDMTRWPRYKAGASFLAHVSHPDGGGARRFHPGGDTHPGRPDPIAYAAEFGVRADPKTFESEEFPGFGCVLRNRPGTGDETYVAFKAGPNRGHFHGDQLSLHWCARGRPLAIDHRCSYSPRPGQEHMHNRVAFHTDAWPYANMDGHERVLAFKTSPAADVAVGQVESDRLRKQLKLPPEDWDAIGPLHPLDMRLTYRRTVVLVKGGPEDYLVLRDQAVGPDLTAVFCLHVLGDEVKPVGGPARLQWDRLTLVAAKPEASALRFEAFPWEHTKGGGEKTAGARLSTKGDDVEFIIVLYPSKRTPPIEPVPGGVKVGGDTVTFAGGLNAADDAACVTVARGGKPVLTLTGAEIDLDRDQGDVGLFVPDAGYIFGPLPAWLIRQRSEVPDWHRAWPGAAQP